MLRIHADIEPAVPGLADCLNDSGYRSVGPSDRSRRFSGRSILVAVHSTASHPSASVWAILADAIHPREGFRLVFSPSGCNLSLFLVQLGRLATLEGPPSGIVQPAQSPVCLPFPTRVCARHGTLYGAEVSDLITWNHHRAGCRRRRLPLHTPLQVRVRVSRLQLRRFCCPSARLYSTSSTPGTSVPTSLALGPKTPWPAFCQSLPRGFTGTPLRPRLGSAGRSRGLRKHWWDPPVATPGMISRRDSHRGTPSVG